MPHELELALLRLRRLRGEVAAAEKARKIALPLLEEVGEIGGLLAAAGASSFTLNDARKLLERAMQIPTEL